MVGNIGTNAEIKQTSDRGTGIMYYNGMIIGFGYLCCGPVQLWGKEMIIESWFPKWIAQRPFSMTTNPLVVQLDELSQLITAC